MKSLPVLALLIFAGSIRAATAAEAGCILDEASVAEFKKQREEVAAKQKTLEERTNELAAREAALQEEMKKLQLLKAEITGIEASKKAEREAQIQRVVEALEKMSPKTAAPMLSRMQDELVVAALEKLTSVKMAKILAAMEPERSARIATRLAKGGEESDAKSDGTRNPAGSKR